MRAPEVKLYLDSVAVASATGVSVSLTQGADQYRPIPGTDEDDGWAHFKPGELGWSVEHDGLFTSAATALATNLTTDAQLDLMVYLGEHILGGDCRVSEVSVSAQVHDICKISAKITCDGFPTFN